MSASPTESPFSDSDRAAIVELFARYAWAFDTGDADVFVTLFTPNGVFDGVRQQFSGHSELRRLAEGMKAPDYRGAQHWVGNSIFEGNSHTCTVQSMCFAPRQVGSELAVVLVGYYIDKCIKIKGRWIFARRRFRRWTGGVLDRERPWETGVEDHEPP